MKIYLLLFLQIILYLCHGMRLDDDICMSTTPTCACCKSGKCIVAGGNACDGCRDVFTTDTCRDPCPYTCFNCSQTFFSLDRTCYACKPGYYNGRWEDNMELPLHKDCSLKCKSGCKICDSYNNCNQCNSGHLMSSRNMCEQCQENCEICSSATNCIKCKDAYFKGGDGGCKSCIPHCKTCRSYVDCQECEKGFYWNEKECRICQEGCISCQDTRICNKCEKGYHLFDTKCFHFPEISCAYNTNSIVCKEECLNRCLNRVCNGSDGSCTVGCLSGYWGGNTCNQTCVTFCKDTVCQFSDGKCNALFSSHVRPFRLFIGLAISGAVVIIIAVMCTCYFKRTNLSRRFKWLNAVDDCLCLCYRRFHKDQHYKGKAEDEVTEVVMKPLYTSSEQTNSVNTLDKNQTESLLPALKLRIEKDVHGTPCNNPNEGFPKYNPNAKNVTNTLDEPQTDNEDRCFINVASYKMSSKYIVSYGSKIALNNESFWRKIWESQCERIVMLSQELEEFNHNLTIGPDEFKITVRFALGRAWANYIVIPVTMEQGTVETLKETHVVLFEFFADIQNNVKSFLEFHKMVNGVNKKLNGLTLVHCSTGVHRCVTYIAVDMLLKNAKTISKGDISLCLQHLNKHSLETTQEQVDYIFKILAQLSSTHD